MNPRCDQVESRDFSPGLSSKAFPPGDRFFRYVYHLLASRDRPLIPPLSARNSQWEQTAGVVILKPLTRNFGRHRVLQKRDLRFSGLHVLFHIVTLENVPPV